jgi:integrase
VRFAEEGGHVGPLTLDLAENWARSSRISDPCTWSRRISVVRPFARYLSAVEPGTEVPPRRIFGPAHRRLPPHIYSREDVVQIVNAAADLPPRGGLRPLTFSTLFALLSCTGLRVSEALRLEVADVELTRAVLRVRETKFRKSRLVPLHDSTARALQRYERQRDEFIDTAPRAFFVLDDGVPVSYSRTRTALRAVRRKLRWDQLPSRSRPNLRSLRHTFACLRLTSWYDEGVEVNGRIHDLSTYMGHGKVSDTYWYLSGIPRLLEVAARRFHSTPRGAEEDASCGT